ncbi:hypothetical protein CspeluHIS016_0404030 [Cutaneotrichosporon spelunceum]|uniref:Uncharacterized protein n=1 Tax=Cutaneotrichosporon spelunceum TaxID=1672016 RepID=A0AAD3TVB1_9TREE|nr:hypothetical protein CspeluHIS016_0404030 [Cutaneotrichosporon spelunceum]
MPGSKKKNRRRLGPTVPQHWRDPHGARRHEARISRLPDLLSDPEEPLQSEHVAELSRLRSAERRLSRATVCDPAERAARRMLNIQILRRFAGDTNNPRRETHAEQLRLAEAAQARYDNRGWAIIQASCGGGVVHAHYAEGTWTWHASEAVQLDTGFGQRDFWVNVTIVGNPAGVPLSNASGDLLETRSATLPYSNEDNAHQCNIEPHDLPMASPSRCALSRITHPMDAPVSGRKIASLPRSSWQTGGGSCWSSPESAVSAVLVNGNEESPSETWAGKRKRPHSPSLADAYEGDSVTSKKNRASDGYHPTRSYAPAPRRYVPSRRETAPRREAFWRR